MLRLTWDTNCIIMMESDDEKRAADRSALEELLALHDAGLLQIRVPAAMVSETRIEGSYLIDFKKFRARLAADGLERLVSVPAPAAFNQSFWGEEDTMAFPDGRLERIFDVMFPQSSFEGPVEESEPTWWGRRIDAAVYWGHINSGGDLCVTADRRGFINGGRREQLLAIDGRGIETPVSATGWVRRDLT